jgi:hypothetical protein
MHDPALARRLVARFLAGRASARAAGLFSRNQQTISGLAPDSSSPFLIVVQYVMTAAGLCKLEDLASLPIYFHVPAVSFVRHIAILRPDPQLAPSRNATAVTLPR